MTLADNIRGSVIKFCQGLIAELANEGVGEFKFVDFDTHANLQELPQIDLMGPVALGWVDTGGGVEITFAIGVATHNDTNLFRSWKAIGKSFEVLRPAKAIPFYDSETLEVINQMIATSGTTVSPMSNAELRPFQFVQATLLLETQ